MENAMQIEPLTRIDQIQTGDALLISDGKTITQATAHRVKVSDFDGTEVIFDVKRNKYFNVGMYLEGASWAKDIRVVRSLQNLPTCTKSQTAIERLRTELALAVPAMREYAHKNQVHNFGDTPQDPQGVHA